MKTTIVRRLSAPYGHWPVHVHPVLRRVYAARGVLCASQAEHRLAALLPPHGLSGMARVTELLAVAIAKQQHIMIAADFDCDGACGAAIAVRGLRLLGATNVGYAVPHRMRHGYGLTPALVETLQPAPDVIVTVDNGIASHAGVTAAKARGCTVVITDHHLPGATLPDADAIVNPNLPGDGFASKVLCGAGVMFYLLLALRALLRERGAFADREEPDLSSLLDLLALATVADLVSLDRNNRILVESGLRRMRAGRACAGVIALMEVAGCDAARLSASDLGYSVAPRINAAGRLEDMTLGIEALAELDAREPGLIQRFGGHAMAAGLSLRISALPRFTECFDAIARERIAPEALQAQLHSDGELAPDDFDLELARQLRAAGPWGQGFPPPLFDNVFECVGWKRIGAEQRHLRANLRDPRDGRVHTAVQFNTESDWPAVAAVRVVYELAIDEWQGVQTLRLIVRHVEPAFAAIHATALA